MKLFLIVHVSIWKDGFLTTKFVTWKCSRSLLINFDLIKDY